MVLALSPSTCSELVVFSLKEGIRRVFLCSPITHLGELQYHGFKRLIRDYPTEW